MNILKEIKEYLDKTTIKLAKIYFIERKLRPDVNLRTKMLNKYAFYVKRIESDIKVQELLFNTVLDKINSITDKENFVLEEYQVISTDERNTIYSYQITNKSIPFYDIINNQLMTKKIDSIRSLNDIASTIWAYILEVEFPDNKRLYAFRRIHQTSIMIDKKKGRSSKSFLANLNTTNSQLELYSGENITIDLSIDCIYWEDSFYIFQKKNFEEILGLEEEYKNQALKSLEAMQQNSFFNSMCAEIVSNLINTNNKWNRKLSKIIDELRNVDEVRIKQMQEIAKNYDFELQLDTEGKIGINDETDLENLLLLLEDAFVESKQTGKKYKATIKKEIKNRDVDMTTSST